MKKYILYAGVNGAGKSTLHQTTKYKDSMPRINTDEILRTIGDWTKTSDIMEAGKIAVKRLNKYLEDEITSIKKQLFVVIQYLKVLKKLKNEVMLLKCTMSVLHQWT